jgi:hypothetical protein
MDLTKSLRKVGYDLIESPIRNHKLSQLWLKKDFDRVQMYHDNISYAFRSNIVLNEITNDALSVTSVSKNEYEFNVGLTVLENILVSLGINNLNLGLEIKNGRSVSISYDNSFNKEIGIGPLENYLSSSDFLHPNESLLRNLNRNDVLVTTGILYAKNLVVEIETNFNLTSELESKLDQLADGKIAFSHSSENKLKMISDTGNHFPIAVKASRLDFDHGKFKNQKLVTDNRNFF